MKVFVLLSIFTSAAALRAIPDHQTPREPDTIMSLPKLTDKQVKNLMEKSKNEEADLLAGKKPKLSLTKQINNFRVILGRKETEQPAQPKCGVVWLHGIGGPGADGQVVSHFIEKENCMMAFPYPEGGNGWFSLDKPSNVFLTPDYKPPYHGANMEELHSNIKKVHEAIDSLKAQGIPADRIAVGGFSMGAAEAMIAAFQYPERLGAAISVSSTVPLDSDLVKPEVHRENQGLSVLALHGSQDNQVSPEFLPLMSKTLRDSGFEVTQKSFQGSHEMNNEVGESIGAFVHSHIGDGYKPRSWFASLR